MSQGLGDKALEVPNSLNFFPVPCRKALLDTFPTTDGVRFTYYSGKTASRLDRFRAPKEVKTEKCNIVVTPWSDHTILAVELSFGQVYPRGRPLWRLRPKMLDASCRDNMANVLANMLTLSDIYFDELPEWWERTKRAIRNSCRKYEFKVNRRGLQHYQEAVFHFLQCHSRMNQGRPYDEEVLVRSRKVIAEFHYTQRRNRLNYRDYRVKGSAVDVEEWAKARSPKTPIEMKGLREKEGDAVAFHPQEMLSIMGRYYQQLFAPKDIDSREVERFLEDIPREKAGSLYGKLTEAESQMLEAPIEEEEVRRAIVTAKGNSAPGADGLGYEFYKIFREWLVPPLTKVFNALLARERLTESFYQGTLIFFPKKGDLTLPANWRPIALTNMDYRLLAKILNRRLASVAHKLVVGCQTSAVPGRAMTDSLCLMREIFQLVRDRKWAGRILLLDQSKAFDNVHHSFLWRVLRWKGLPPSYVGFLKLLYAEATVTPQINGHRGSRIDLQSGVRQGCPLSPLLYVLALDAVLCRVQLEEGIAGIRSALPTGAPIQIKFVAHADDISLLLNDDREVRSVQQIFDTYARASGSQINGKKSCLISFDPEDEQLKIAPMETDQEGEGRNEQKVEEVKILGIYYSIAKEGWKRNWLAWLQKFREKIAMWRKWQLTVYQKAVYVRTYVLPVAHNIVVVYPPPGAVMKELEKELFKFLWGMATFPLARAVAYRQIDQAGLDLPALSLRMFTTFLSYNFGKYAQWEEGGDQPHMWVVLFAQHWVGKPWAETWWGEHSLDFTVSAKMRCTGPEYLRELYSFIKQHKVHAEWFGTSRGDLRSIKQAVYRELLEVAYFRPQVVKRARRESLSRYLREQTYPIEYFQDRRVPFRLWDIRWRLYHQVYDLQGTRPWLPERAQACPRLQCKSGAVASGTVQKETVRHFVSDCPTARATWKAVSEALDWPDLGSQDWESVVSGTEPTSPLKGPRRRVPRKRRWRETTAPKSYWTVPWSTIRLINLYVLLALSLQRHREIKTQKVADVAGSVKFVQEKIFWLSREEKGRMPPSRWRKLWPWLSGAHAPIT
uniref:Reverse transcriptase domain-containing protein n=2 Tax=Varanus komodoensis TaxID=61221 RepID=A0A8D2PZX4_VARKO